MKEKNKFRFPSIPHTFSFEIPWVYHEKKIYKAGEKFTDFIISDTRNTERISECKSLQATSLEKNFYFTEIKVLYLIKFLDYQIEDEFKKTGIQLKINNIDFGFYPIGIINSVVSFKNIAYPYGGNCEIIYKGGDKLFSNEDSIIEFYIYCHSCEEINL